MVCGMQAGSITVPAQGGMFYLSQRPYLVSGSLRDQLLYPQPPRLVWQNASKPNKAKYAPYTTQPEAVFHTHCRGICRRVTA